MTNRTARRPWERLTSMPPAVRAGRQLGAGGRSRRIQCKRRPGSTSNHPSARTPSALQAHTELVLASGQTLARGGLQDLRSASSRADPMCSISRDPAGEPYTIRTAVASGAVFTVRTHGGHGPALRARISAQIRSPQPTNPQVGELHTLRPPKVSRVRLSADHLTGGGAVRGGVRRVRGLQRVPAHLPEERVPAQPGRRRGHDGRLRAAGRADAAGGRLAVRPGGARPRTGASGSYAWGLRALAIVAAAVMAYSAATRRQPVTARDASPGSACGW